MGSSNSFSSNYPQAEPIPQESEVHALVDLVSSPDNGQIFQLLRYILLQSLPHKIRKRGLGDGESSSPRGLVSCWNDSDAEHRGTMLWSKFILRDTLGVTAEYNPPDVDYPVVEELWIWFSPMKRIISCRCFFHFGLNGCFACDSLSPPRVPSDDGYRPITYVW